MRSHPRAKVQGLRLAVAALRKKAAQYHKADDQFATYNGALMDEAADIVERLMKKEVKADMKVREVV